MVAEMGLGRAEKTGRGEEGQLHCILKSPRGGGSPGWAEDMAFLIIQWWGRVLQAGTEGGSRNKSHQEGHVPTSMASSNGHKEADSWSRAARVVVNILITKIHWGMNRQCVRLFMGLLKQIISWSGKLYRTSLEMEVGHWWQN